MHFNDNNQSSTVYGYKFSGIENGVAKCVSDDSVSNSSTASNILCPTITFSNNMATIEYTITEGIEYEAYKENVSNNLTVASGTCLNVFMSKNPYDLITGKGNVSWSVRLYEGTNDMWIGSGYFQYPCVVCGTDHSSDIQYPNGKKNPASVPEDNGGDSTNVSKADDIFYDYPYARIQVVSGKYYVLSDKTRIVFKTSPSEMIDNARHGNWKVIKGDDGTPKVTAGTLLGDTFQHYDTQAQYHIKYDNIKYEITDSIFGYIDSYENNTDMFLSIPYTDAANTALKPTCVSYVSTGGEQIRYTSLSTAVYDNDNSIGDNYTLWCNYIDSDEYYFSVMSVPTVTFATTDLHAHGTSTSVANPVKDTIYDLSYSNLTLDGTYAQNEGASIVHYSFTLYELKGYTIANSTTSGTTNNIFTKKRIVDTTGDIYSTTISYNYGYFKPKTYYRVHFECVDTSGLATTYEFDVYTNYEEVATGTKVTVNGYQTHGSAIIDFSGIISATPTFYSYTTELSDAGASVYDGNPFTEITETVTHTDSAGKSTTDKTYCGELKEGYKAVYAAYDSGDDMEYNLKNIYMRFKIDSDKTGTIAVVAFDKTSAKNAKETDGIIVSTDGINLGVSGIKINPYSNTNANYNSYINDKTGTESTVLTAETTYGIKVDFPWEWRSDLQVTDTWFWHEETLLSQNWVGIVKGIDASAFFVDLGDGSKVANFEKRS